MPEKLTRRKALELAAATGAASGLMAGTAGANEGGNPERIVGTTGEGGSQRAREEADHVFKTLDFGDIGQAVSGRFSDEAADRLSSKGFVRYVEDNDEMEALEQTTPYGIEITDADVAIDDGHTGDGVSVAVIDTGIDAQHEDLAEHLGDGKAITECSTSGGCLFGGGNDIDECLEPWDDDNDHGTHCAGTVGAIDNDVGVLGVAPDVTLHAVKVLDRCGSGSYDDIAEGIKWSADQGHEVQSMSLGGDESDVVKDAVEYAAARNVVIVAAAGNDGECTDCVGHPAAYEEVIAVSATDENDELASFSSTGPEVELAAPGVDVLSTIPRDDYDEFSGTSMACPHVSGGAATVIADGTTDREAVRQQLKDTADDIGLDDNEQGAGRLNVADAVNADDGGDDSGELSVVTDGATDVGENSATLNGELTDLGGAEEADVGFEYGVAGEGLDSTADAGTLSSTDPFDAEVDGLDSDTEYEFRAVADGDDGSADTGDVLTFTTGEDDEEDEETTAPTIDTFDLSDESNPRWARVEVDWAVSDDDGNLDTVESVLNDGVDSETSLVSGDSASGLHELEERDGHGEAEVTLTVTDTDGNSTSDTKTIELS